MAAVSNSTHTICTFLFIFSEITKNLKNTGRHCLIYIIPKVSGKFLNNLLIRFRDISHTALKNTVSGRTRLNFRKIIYK